VAPVVELVVVVSVNELEVVDVDVWVEGGVELIEVTGTAVVDELVVGVELVEVVELCVEELVVDVLGKEA
jgi:hypothetical protein